MWHKAYSAVLAVALTVVALTGCKSNLGDRLSEGREGIEAAAQEGLRGLIQQRATRIEETFDPRMVLDGQADALYRWRKESLGDSLAERAQALARASELASNVDQIRDAAQFLQEQSAYWADTKGKLNSYHAFLRTFLTRDNPPDAPFIEHARFEREFLHAAHFHKLKRYDPDTALTSFYRHWKFAFDFPPTPREPFIHYVDRLCRERLWDYCKPLLWEHRPYALKKPYLERLIASLEAFRDDYPDSVFDPVAKALIEMYMAEDATVGPFEEYPVLADGRTTRDAVKGTELVIGTRGVAWNLALLHEFDDGRIALDGAARQKVLGDFDKKLQEILDAEAEVVDDPVIQFAIANIDARTPMALVAGFFERFRERRLTELGLIARRRADDSNRKVGTYLTVFYTPAPPNEDIESRKTDEQREADAEGRLENDPRRKLPARLGKHRCEPLGRTGKQMAAHRAPTRYALLGEKQIAIGPVDQPESWVEQTATAGRPSGTLARDPAALAAWIAESEEPALLAFDTDMSYGDFMSLLQAALIVCEQPDCADGQERETQLHLALCR